MISYKKLSGTRPPRAIIRYAANVRDPKNHTGYYTRPGGAPSRWIGQGAAALGLSGAVSLSRLEQLLAGEIGEGVRVRAPGKIRRLGIDLTVSAPKAYSLCALALGDARLLVLHDQAVEAAMAYIERHTLFARRGSRGVHREPTGHLLAAAFRHEDARPVAGLVDPQLHTHVLTINATRRADGRWVAAHFNFRRHARALREADALYLSCLREGLLRLGYSVRADHGNGLDLAIEGLDADRIAAFSRRRAQIDAALAARGRSRKTATAAQRLAANLATRAPKTPLDERAQRRQWRTRALEAGLQIILGPPTPTASLERVAQDSTAGVQFRAPRSG